jgi:hypothetical protein
MSGSLAKSVFAMFQGVWSLNRIIAGHGFMKGTGRFEKYNSNSTSTQELLYKEDGLFEFDNGSKLETHKEYLFVYENDQLGVFFFENKKRDRLFHLLDFEQTEGDNKKFLLATATHHCSPDVYKVTYEIYNNDEFKIVYKVNGPSKDYVSQTDFKRVH